MNWSYYHGKTSVTGKLFHIVFWLIITVLFLYDRRYLIQKFNLPEHFAACVTVRLLLIMSLVYFHLYVLIPVFFRKRRYAVYGLILLLSLLLYVSLQNLYDIYLYGYVIGDLRSRDFWSAFPYNFFTTSWYLVLTAGLKAGLDYYESKKNKSPGWPQTGHLPENGQENSVFLKTGTKQVKISLDTITHIKGLKDYSIIYTTEEQIIVKGSLKSTETLLKGKRLILVNK